MARQFDSGDPARRGGVSATALVVLMLVVFLLAIGAYFLFFAGPGSAGTTEEPTLAAVDQTVAVEDEEVIDESGALDVDVDDPRADTADSDGG